MIPNLHMVDYSFWKKPYTYGFGYSAAWLLAALVATSVDNNLFRGAFLIGCIATIAYTAKQCVNEQVEEDMIYVNYGVLPRMMP
jgi:hypothetical protein